MTQIHWTVDAVLTLGPHSIPCATQSEDGQSQQDGVKRYTKRGLVLRRVLWPTYKLWLDLFVDGFIEWETGRLIRKYCTGDSVFLEVGCGDMSLRRFVPRGICYNALDVQFSEFHLRRVLAKDSRINVVIASATQIPARSDVATVIVSTETFEHIVDIDRAMREVYRVAAPGAILICTIPNNYCWKYQRKGPHTGHVNNWTYDGFIRFMEGHRFELLEGFMKGYWLPLPLWLTKTSYQLPVTSASEAYNTNFFYVFQAAK